MNADYIKIEECKEKLKNSLTEKRYQHTIRTLNKAMELSVGTDADKEIVFWAALLHDCAKYITPTKEQEKEIADFLGFDKIIHAPLGAIVARDEYGINDEKILNAIKYHSTGRKNMTVEEKIVFLADAIEDGREYPNLSNIRKQTENSLEKGIVASLEGIVTFEGAQGNKIHHLTLEAIEDLKGK